MSVGEYCNREVVVMTASESVRDAAKLMREFHVGDVVVVEKVADGSLPKGILTDRDIVVELVAEDVDLDAVAVGDVMSTELVEVGEETKLMDAIKLMRGKAIRRLIVITADGHLAGLLTVDDILELITEQLSDLTALVFNEIRKEGERRA